MASYYRHCSATDAETFAPITNTDLVNTTTQVGHYVALGMYSLKMLVEPDNQSRCPGRQAALLNAIDLSVVMPDISQQISIVNYLGIPAESISCVYIYGMTGGTKEIKDIRVNVEHTSR